MGTGNFSDDFKRDAAATRNPDKAAESRTSHLSLGLASISDMPH